MDSDNIKIVDRASAVDAINRLGVEDLRFLNRLIVERLQLLAQVHATEQMARFTRGDRVGFHASDGELLQGVVLRLNKKTVSVVTDDGDRWNVSPALLHLVRSAEEGR